MLDADVLKHEIQKRGKTINELALGIGINKSTLRRKLKAGGDTLMLWEIKSIIKQLGLSAEEAVSLFLA